MAEPKYAYIATHASPETIKERETEELPTVGDVVTRSAGRRGVSKVTHRPDLHLENFRVAAPSNPVLPLSFDASGGMTNQWGMLGNDQWGDCVIAATEHGRMAKGVVAPATLPGHVQTNPPTYEKGFVPPNTTTTEALYWDYQIAKEGGVPPHPDNGSDPATWLQYLFELSQLNAAQQRAQGVAQDDIVELAYAELDLSNPATVLDTLRRACIDFHGVLITVHLTTNADQLFESHQPWTLAGTEINLYEGHGIWLDYYDPDFMKFVTWGLHQRATLGWVTGCVTSAWVFLTKEDAQRAGYNFQGAINTIKGLETP